MGRLVARLATAQTTAWSRAVLTTEEVVDVVYVAVAMLVLARMVLEETALETVVLLVARETLAVLRAEVKMLLVVVVVVVAATVVVVVLVVVGAALGVTLSTTGSSGSYTSDELCAGMLVVKAVAVLGLSDACEEVYSGSLASELCAAVLSTAMRGVIVSCEAKAVVLAALVVVVLAMLLAVVLAMLVSAPCGDVSSKSYASELYTVELCAKGGGELPSSLVVAGALADDSVVLGASGSTCGSEEVAWISLGEVMGALDVMESEVAAAVTVLEMSRLSSEAILSCAAVLLVEVLSYTRGRVGQSDEMMHVSL